MSNLSRIFFIYTEAHMAVFMLAVALIEFICYLAIPEHFISYVALAAAVAFTAIALSSVLYIVHQERKYSR